MKEILKDLSTYPHFRGNNLIYPLPSLSLKTGKMQFQLELYTTVLLLYSMSIVPHCSATFFLRLLTRFFPVAVFVAGAPVRSVDVELGEDIVSA